MFWGMAVGWCCGAFGLIFGWFWYDVGLALACFWSALGLMQNADDPIFASFSMKLLGNDG